MRDGWRTVIADSEGFLGLAAIALRKFANTGRAVRGRQLYRGWLSFPGEGRSIPAKRSVPASTMNCALSRTSCKLPPSAGVGR